MRYGCYFPSSNRYDTDVEYYVELNIILSSLIWVFYQTNRVRIIFSSDGQCSNMFYNHSLDKYRCVNTAPVEVCYIYLFLFNALDTFLLIVISTSYMFLQENAQWFTKGD